MSEEPSQLFLTENVHFTYKANPDMNSLCQGDVLIKTDELIETLRTVHPYFCNEEYKYFMVLSQSCDLVRRNGGKCKTPYITLAAVRDYDDFLAKTLIGNNMAENCHGFLLVEEKARTRVYQMIERVYNNTEPEYFFLYKDNTLDFPKPMVVYLKVSIALKSEAHYQKCLNAKQLELSDEFKAKLGWLVGNMYSRVGTADWESVMDKENRRRMIDDNINSKCVVGSKEQLSRLKKELDINLDLMNSREAVDNFLSNITVKSKYEQVMDIIEEVINNTCIHTVKNEDKEKIFNAIKSRRKIEQLIQ